MTAKKYSLGLVGRKAGMTRVFTEDGKSIPVTLIEATQRPAVGHGILIVEDN